MLEEIKVFVVVVKLGSFTLAAEALETSRSVVSKKVSELEEKLQLRLLNRTTRRLSLTEVGEMLYRQAGESFARIEETVDEITSLASEPRGRLQVNLPMSFGILHVAPRIKGFLERYPAIQLSMHFEDRRVELIDQGFDVSIRISELEDSSLAARKIAPCDHFVVASPTYLQKYGWPAEVAALAQNHSIISNRLQDSALIWEFEDERGSTSSVRLSASLVADNSLAIKTMVQDGLGIARMPSFLVAAEIGKGTLINLFPDLLTNRKFIYAVFPKREYMPTKSRVFIDYLLEMLREQEFSRSD